MSENMSICPFIKSHMIRPERMQRHLIICKKDILSKPDHPAYKLVMNMERCPYNATHLINKHEMKRHIEVCNSKRVVATPTEVPAWRKSVVVARSEAAVEASEDWDDDNNQDAYLRTPYNPQAKILKSTTPILHLPPGMSRAEKSDFRSRQRAKYVGGQTEAFDDWGVANSLNRLDMDHNDDYKENIKERQINKGSEVEKVEVTNDFDEFKIVGKKKQNRKKNVQSSLLVQTPW